jgi:DNA-binding transcriptional ArsR family regulator
MMLRREARLFDKAALAEIGALVGDPGRASMLAALLDGRALTASEMAAQAGVAAQTASGHLAKLAASGLIVVRRQGRHRYHALASPEVARMLESITEMAAARHDGRAAMAPRLGPKDAALRAARTCYDHLAGRLAVAIADAMSDRSLIEIERDGGILTHAGQAFLEDFGIDLSRTPSRRVLVRTCVDWSERRLHLAGAIGAAILRRSLELHWVRRIQGTRALRVTTSGQLGYRKLFGIPF